MAHDLLMTDLTLADYRVICEAVSLYESEFAPAVAGEGQSNGQLLASLCATWVAGVRACQELVVARPVKFCDRCGGACVGDKGVVVCLKCSKTWAR